MREPGSRALVFLVELDRHRGYGQERGQGMERERRSIGMGRDADRARAWWKFGVSVRMRGFQPGEHQQQQDTHQRQAPAASGLEFAHHLPLGVRMILAERARASRYSKGAAQAKT